MTQQTITRTGFMGLLGGVAAACTPLSAFNTLAPVDPAARAGRDIAYGPLPRQKLDIYAPAKAEKPAPVLVFFYGGGWVTGRRQDYAFAGKALASRGFLTVVPDYRLVPEVRYPRFVEDGALALRWVREHAAEYGGDPRRVVLAGHSAGAYIAVMLALDPAFATAAGADPADIRAVAGLSGPYKFLPLRAPATIAAFGGAPDLEATQPINHVHAGAPPALLLHGARDLAVSPKNSIRLAQALQAVGATAEAKIYPGLGHPAMVLALSRPFRGKAPVLDDMTAFLMEHA